MYNVIACFNFRLLPTKIGKLFVGKPEKLFSTMKVSKNMKHLDNKIIECKYQDGRWQFMRERTDKSFPNGFETAKCKYLLNLFLFSTVVED